MNGKAEFEVIVHPSGMLDSDEAGHWTEVTALPSCIAEGRTVEEAVSKTREAIINWLAKASQRSEPEEKAETVEVDLKITIAY